MLLLEGPGHADRFCIRATSHIHVQPLMFQHGVPPGQFGELSQWKSVIFEVSSGDSHVPACSVESVTVAPGINNG